MDAHLRKVSAGWVSIIYHERYEVCHRARLLLLDEDSGESITQDTPARSCEHLRCN